MPRRPLSTKTTGDTLLQLEPLLAALCDQGLQHGDILALVWVYLVVHQPGAREEYTEGGHPEFYYGYSRNNS